MTDIAAALGEKQPMAVYSALSKDDNWKVHIVGKDDTFAPALCGQQPKGGWWEIEAHRSIECQGCLAVLASIKMLPEVIQSNRTLIKKSRRLADEINRLLWGARGVDSLTRNMLSESEEAIRALIVALGGNGGIGRDMPTRLL